MSGNGQTTRQYSTASRRPPGCSSSSWPPCPGPGGGATASAPCPTTRDRAPPAASSCWSAARRRPPRRSAAEEESPGRSHGPSALANTAFGRRAGCPSGEDLDRPRHRSLPPRRGRAGRNAASTVLVVSSLPHPPPAPPSSSWQLGPGPGPKRVLLAPSLLSWMRRRAARCRRSRGPPAATASRSPRRCRTPTPSRRAPRGAAASPWPGRRACPAAETRAATSCPCPRFPVPDPGEE
ncbi:hypothetical protein GGR56DRAFT_113548 [Xylariaceae sp. FL0804]|nr:hypothetical protein GGR56DRAFT_113548 [Xylariaceae sp. FL0804]